MSHQLEIQPRELRFIVELNKQSKCTIRLVNKTDDNVAFKVKTTSPKKYCVRPNVGVVPPKAVHEFIVIMQAPKEFPDELICKDKFLIQNTIVPEGTGEADITSEMFLKNSGRYIEDSKLRVILAYPPQPRSPESAPINGTQKQVDDLVESKTVSTEEMKPVKDANDIPIYNVTLEPIKFVRFEPSKAVDSDIVNQVGSDLAKDIESITKKNEEVPGIELRVPEGEEEQRLFKEVEEMKFKLQELESKLNKTEGTISKLTEERRFAIQERESLQQEMVAKTPMSIPSIFFSPGCSEKEKSREKSAGWLPAFVCLHGSTYKSCGWIWFSSLRTIVEHRLHKWRLIFH